MALNDNKFSMKQGSIDNNFETIVILHDTHTHMEGG